MKVYAAGRLTVIVDVGTARVALSTDEARRMADALKATAATSEDAYTRDVRENGPVRGRVGTA